MTRITQTILAEAVVELERMGTHAQLGLGDDIFARQPPLLGAVVVLRRFGANDAQIGIALHVLFVVWLAMKRCEVQKRLRWPVISEDVHDQGMQRLPARAGFTEGLPSALQQQTDEHDERYILSFALGHLHDHGILNFKSEAEKQVVLSALGIVECITSSAPRTGRRSVRQKRRWLNAYDTRTGRWHCGMLRATDRSRLRTNSIDTAQTRASKMAAP